MARGERVQTMADYITRRLRWFIQILNNPVAVISMLRLI
jgi:hypothetical protein